MSPNNKITVEIDANEYQALLRCATMLRSLEYCLYAAVGYDENSANGRYIRNARNAIAALEAAQKDAIK